MSRPGANGGAFGKLLRQWRSERRLSQLDLSLVSGASARHLGFLELGRSNPSREMVLRLAEALDVPPRERNVLLQAAGFAPLFRETDLAAPEMAEVRAAIEFILTQHQPNPSVLMDRHYNLLMRNRAFARGLRRFISDADYASKHPNFVRLLLDPRGLGRTLVNALEILSRMKRRLERQLAIEPGDAQTAALLQEIGARSEVDSLATGLEAASGDSLLVPIHLKTDDMELRLFTTATSLSSAVDITLHELFIETYFPADESSRRILRAVEAEPV